MNRELRTKWVDALRSGEYAQGTGALRTGNGNDRFCCLGVLCDLIDPDQWQDKESHRSLYRWGDTPDANKMVLPPETRDDIGLSVGAENELTSLNDSGTSFNEIAGWIEDRL